MFDRGICLVPVSCTDRCLLEKTASRCNYPSVVRLRRSRGSIVNFLVFFPTMDVLINNQLGCWSYWYCAAGPIQQCLRGLHLHLYVCWSWKNRAISYFVTSKDRVKDFYGFWLDAINNLRWNRSTRAFPSGGPDRYEFFGRVVSYSTNKPGRNKSIFSIVMSAWLDPANKLGTIQTYSWSSPCSTSMQGVKCPDRLKSLDATRRQAAGHIGTTIRLHCPSTLSSFCLLPSRPSKLWG